MVSASGGNLEAYLRRIGYTGPVAPELGVLKDIIFHHATTIPFENLDPLLGRPVRLAPADLEAKMMAGGRGGYCFEQNLLLADALTAIGFDVTGLAARVLWRAAHDREITPRTHMLLRIDLEEGTHLVDVGFGGMTLTGVPALTLDGVQETPHEPVRLTDIDGDWGLQAQVAGQWKTLYRFDLQPQHRVDYETVNHFVATHPSSIFTVNLMAGRATNEGRLALRNRDLTFYPAEGRAEKRRLESSAEIRAVLEQEFGIALPETPGLMARLEALP